jgi:hypothetical protein
MGKAFWTWTLAAAICAGAAMVMPQHGSAQQTAAVRAVPTSVLNAAAMQRLRRNGGMTLQWIGWDQRGPVQATMRGRTLWLRGEQVAPAGAAGRVSLNGWVREVGERHFVLVGEVVISDTPDVGRRCVRTGEMRFQVTQNRRYWRMQRMSECDGLTDYVDVYF